MNTWKGFKDFRVTKKVEENKYITSFYLQPAEGGDIELPAYLPGQFIAIRAKDIEGNYSKPRQYTLSSPSNGVYYRISVKREEEGNVSKLLCDTVQIGDIVQVALPVGKFVLKEKQSPVVLIGGGIGITPMLTMAYEAMNKKRPAHLIYSLPNSAYHAFDEEIKKLKGSTVKTTIIYTRPTVEDKVTEAYDVEGRLTREWLNNELVADGEYYFCGPIEFMRTVYHYLIELGVQKENIHYELFAPGEDITKPAR